MSKAKEPPRRPVGRPKGDGSVHLGTRVKIAVSQQIEVIAKDCKWSVSKAIAVLLDEALAARQSAD